MWNELNPVLKGIAGILAFVTVIPAIIVSVKSTHGFVKTFFDRCPTDSWKKLHDFEIGVTTLTNSIDEFQNNAESKTC